mgnify:FL=1
MDKFYSVIAAVVAFAATSLLGYSVIPKLKKLHIGQTILEDGPKWHKKKEGTPTMGGIMIIFGFLFAFAVCLIVSSAANKPLVSDFSPALDTVKLYAGIGMAFLMGAIGFADDFIKIVKKRNLGLTARQKTFFQIIVSALYLAVLYFFGHLEYTYIPFVGSVNITSGAGLLFWPIALFFVYGFTNAVNLTDGLDGLATSVTLVVSCFFMMASAAFMRVSHGWYGNVVAASLAGSCAGFFLWNAKPAKVFMGDTGSMFLGGMVVAMSFSLDMPIILILVGIIYFAEAFSVILQVASFKLTGKRIFKMAPLHHHFEMCGFSEEKIVCIFSGVTLIADVAAFLIVLASYK